MAARDLLGVSTVAPGSGNIKHIPVDREGNAYPNDVFFYDVNHVRQKLSSTVASLAAIGCTPLVIKPLAFADKSLPGPPFNSSEASYYLTYQGSAPESFCFSVGASLAFGSGNVTYAVNRVTGPVKINLNCKLTNWQSNGGTARLKLQHTNASNVTVDLYTVNKADVTSDGWYTDAPGNTPRSVSLPATFTGSDVLKLVLDGAGNTAISVNVYSMTVY